jgi:methyl-accepting chemotaxis protein
VVVAAAVLTVAIVLVVLAARAYRILGEMRLSARQNLGPVSDRARRISDNLEFITQALRTDVERLNQSVAQLSERLHVASDRMEERVEEFNALMEMVQGEAEELFLDTASTVRGVREGARSISSRGQDPTRRDRVTDGADVDEDD